MVRQVGADFPVFLHPQTGDEYALARTERKTGPGYKGFAFHASPDVTLEQDLQRRDLTINAMAEDADGTLIVSHGPLRGGSAYTRECAEKHGRPWLHADLAEVAQSCITASAAVPAWKAIV